MGDRRQLVEWVGCGVHSSSSITDESAHQTVGEDNARERSPPYICNMCYIGGTQTRTDGRTPARTADMAALRLAQHIELKHLCNLNPIVTV